MARKQASHVEKCKQHHALRQMKIQKAAVATAVGHLLLGIVVILKTSSHFLSPHGIPVGSQIAHQAQNTTEIFNQKLSEGLLITPPVQSILVTANNQYILGTPFIQNIPGTFNQTLPGMSGDHPNAQQAQGTAVMDTLQESLNRSDLDLRDTSVMTRVEELALQVTQTPLPEVRQLLQEL